MTQLVLTWVLFVAIGFALATLGAVLLRHPRDSAAMIAQVYLFGRNLPPNGEDVPAGLRVMAAIAGLGTLGCGLAVVIAVTVWFVRAVAGW